jgi:outer membrane biosynthesis protein TonB
MCLGVVVAGLAIGALIAVFMQRSTGAPVVASNPVAAASATPLGAEPSALPSPPPVVIATIAPPRTPRPTPPPTDAPSPTQEPTAPPTPPPTRPPTPAPTPRAAPAAVAPAATAERTPASTPRATPSDAAATPAPAATTAAPVATAPASTATVASAYDEHASAVVRRYVDALIAGDDKTALNALGGSGTLSEQAFIDPSSRIVTMKVTRIDASNASVGCEIASAKGHFYATYRVTAATSGPYISEHDYIKV